MTLQSLKPDEVDWQLLSELQADGRLSFNELARRIHLSPPAVAERVRRLEQAGIITGYTARVDAASAGQPLLAFIQLRCSLSRCLLKTTNAKDYPELVEIHKLSGEHCTMLKARTSSLAHLEGLVERLGTHGEMRTHTSCCPPSTTADPSSNPAPHGPSRQRPDGDPEKRTPHGFVLESIAVPLTDPWGDDVDRTRTVSHPIRRSPTGTVGELCRSARRGCSTFGVKSIPNRPANLARLSPPSTKPSATTPTPRSCTGASCASKPTSAAPTQSAAPTGPSKPVLPTSTLSQTKLRTDCCTTSPAHTTHHDEEPSNDLLGAALRAHPLVDRRLVAPVRVVLLREHACAIPERRF